MYVYRWQGYLYFCDMLNMFACVRACVRACVCVCASVAMVAQTRRAKHLGIYIHIYIDVCVCVHVPA